MHTNLKLGISGGLVSYKYAQFDLKAMMESNVDSGYERHFFTTMFDLYALPNDFPEYDECVKIVDRYARVSALEQKYAEDVKDNRFIPYVQLHEFEALVFCGLDYLKDLYPGCEKKIAHLFSDLVKIGNPELINDKPSTAPIKRLINAIESSRKPFYRYNKPKTGKYITGKVGIEELANNCPHFKEWIEKLIKA